MKEKIRFLRGKEWHWLFPVLVLAFLIGIIVPVKAYVQNFSLFSLKPIQVLPSVLICFIAVLAVGVGIGLLILNWQWVRERLGEYYYLAVGIVIALVFVIAVQNKVPGPALLFTGLFGGLLLRKWEHKNVYLIYGTALGIGLAVFIQNKYPLLTLFVWGVVLGLMLKTSLRPIEVYTDIVFGLALAVGVQLLLCNGGLEILSNSQPNWNNQSVEAVLSLHLWGLSLILPSVLRLIDAQMLQKVKQWGSVVLAAIAVVAMAVYLLTADISPISVVTKDDEFKLSSDENVVVFLVDSLDAQYVEDYVLAEDMRLGEEAEEEAGAKDGADKSAFANWLRVMGMAEEASEEPEAYVLDESVSHELLDGFTYFDNVVSGGAPSGIGVPTLLTGMRYSEEYEGADQYSMDANAQSSLFSDLRENGYDVRLYGQSYYLKGVDAGEIDNIRTDIPFRQKSFGTALTNMFRLTAYYGMPYQAKQAFWFPGNDIANNVEIADPKEERYGIWDPSFYSDYLDEGLSVEEAGKAFVVYHLRGATAPYRMDEECNSVGEAETSQSQQIAGVFRMIYEYVQDMKAEGVYDNSTIIIAGTNGEMELGQNPAVFIKRKGDSGAFVCNSQPLTFANLRASLVDGIVADAQEKYGYNMFNQPEAEGPVLREHVATRNQWQNLYNENGNYYRTFLIMDHARGQENIIKTVETEPYSYTLDEWISLCGNDMVQDFPITGLGNNEETYRWTMGQDITMGFSIEEPKDVVFFRMDYAGTIGGMQRVLAFVNNHLVYDGIESGASSIQFPIPIDYAPDGIYNIVLKLPDAVSPNELGLSEDDRLLGLMVTGCVICTPAEEYFYSCQLDQRISLCGEDIAEDFPVKGLAGNEGAYQWTLGNKVRMCFRLDGKPQDTELKLDCHDTFNGTQRVRIFVNGHVEYDGSVEGSDTIQCMVSQEDAPYGVYDVSIELPDAVSPADLGISIDTRKLALQLTGVGLYSTK